MACPTYEGSVFGTIVSVLAIMCVFPGWVAVNLRLIIHGIDDTVSRCFLHCTSSEGRFITATCWSCKAWTRSPSSRSFHFTRQWSTCETAWIGSSTGRRTHGTLVTGERRTGVVGVGARQGLVARDMVDCGQPQKKPRLCLGALLDGWTNRTTRMRAMKNLHDMPLCLRKARRWRMTVVGGPVWTQAG